MSNIPKIAVFASGSGTNFEAIAKACQSGRIKAEISLLIANRDCGAIQRAANLNVPSKIITAAEYNNANQWDEAALSKLNESEIDWIVLAGFLKKIGKPIISKFDNKILNIHPALLPKFGGPGMYGDRVHKAVFDSGDKKTGATIHIVNENFDEGPIVAQKIIDLSGEDTPESISLKVRSIENEFYVETLSHLINE